MCYGHMLLMINDLSGEEIGGMFSEKELKKRCY